MGRLWWVVLATSGCSSIFGLGDPPLEVDAAPVATVSCMVNGYDVCANQMPAGSITFDTDTTIDTSSDCTSVLFDPMGFEVCVVYGVDIDVGLMVTLTAIGPRVLAFAATGTIAIDGEIDVSSRSGYVAGPGGSNAALCSQSRQPGKDSGGGAGGSFQTKGGDAGAGSYGVTTSGLAGDAVASAPAALRAGCPGYVATGNATMDSVGAYGGGGLLVTAGHAIAVSSTGHVHAGGAGGRSPFQFGGSGGGSGGMIRFSAPSVAIHGIVTANGGGGSSASSQTSGATAMFFDGQPGADGGESTQSAVGGAVLAGGTGGVGGFGGATANMISGLGGTGTGAMAGGGGGGGGVGFIIFPSSTDTSGATISPKGTASID